MNRFLLILFVIMSLVSCLRDNQNLLTSVTWKGESKSPVGSDTYETWTFHSDNTFEQTNGAYGTSHSEKEIETITRGTWEWISDTEVITRGTEMVIAGESHSLQGSAANFAIHINEISQDKIVGTIRHEGDTEDSGFAKPFTFYPENI